MARAYGKPGVRLAILDEPARGLDRTMRDEFAARAREAWKDATLLSITHDVASTRVFPRVLIIEDGQLREDGDPEELYARPDSRYRALCDREDQVRDLLWNAATWRRIRMDKGYLSEEVTA
jgi:ATP-binding cassette subfamily B protein